MPRRPSGSGHRIAGLLGGVAGRFRARESAARLQARRISRRAIATEDELRRRFAETIHDGPVQELSGLEMMLSAADQAVERGDGARAREILAQARELAARNVQSLRDEIVALGPDAYDELSLEIALERCLPAWRRRYGVRVSLDVAQMELERDLRGSLFWVAQEAVNNACRHAQPEHVSVKVQRLDETIELRVIDDGRGFGDVDPLAPTEPGHLGLATIRERIELLGGELEIRSSESGTELAVRVPATGG